MFFLLVMTIEIDKSELSTYLKPTALFRKKCVHIIRRGMKEEHNV